jgi:hypothetical protein
MLVVVLKDWVTRRRRPYGRRIARPAGEIGQRAGQPVDLVDDDNINAPRPNDFQQALQRRALHRTARIAAVVIVVANGLPTLMRLALDISLRLPLGVERIEVLFKPLVAGDPSARNAASA